MGGDCSQCISLSDTKPQYECKWCGDTRGCVFPESPCMEYTVDNCPKPSLSKVSPDQKRCDIRNTYIGANEVKYTQLFMIYLVRYITLMVLK